MVADKTQGRSGSDKATQALSKPAHSLDAQDVIEELSVDALQGLSQENAKTRLEKYGTNELEGGAGVQPFKILLRQISNAMMLVGHHDKLHKSTC